MRKQKKHTSIAENRDCSWPSRVFVLPVEHYHRTRASSAVELNFDFDVSQRFTAATNLKMSVPVHVYVRHAISFYSIHARSDILPPRCRMTRRSVAVNHRGCTGLCQTRACAARSNTRCPDNRARWGKLSVMTSYFRQHATPPHLPQERRRASRPDSTTTT